MAFRGLSRPRSLLYIAVSVILLRSPIGDLEIGGSRSAVFSISRGSPGDMNASIAV